MSQRTDGLRFQPYFCTPNPPATAATSRLSRFCVSVFSFTHILRSGHRIFQRPSPPNKPLQVNTLLKIHSLFIILLTLFFGILQGYSQFEPNNDLPMEPVFKVLSKSFGGQQFGALYSDCRFVPNPATNLGVAHNLEDPFFEVEKIYLEVPDTTLELYKQLHPWAIFIAAPFNEPNTSLSIWRVEGCGGGGGTTGIDLSGSASWATSGSKINIKAEHVGNLSSTATTGSLRLRIWATRSRYSGKTITGYIMGTRNLKPLPPLYHYSNITGKVKYRKPPKGKYYTMITVEEYTASGWRIMDYINFRTIFRL